MSKEIDALRNLIAAMDAEEAARNRVDRERDNFRAEIDIDRGTSPLTIPPALERAIEDWAQAFNDLNGARGIAKYLIRAAEMPYETYDPVRECSDCDGEPGSCHMNCGPAVKS